MKKPLPNPLLKERILENRITALALIQYSDD